MLASITDTRTVSRLLMTFILTTLALLLALGSAAAVCINYGDYLHWVGNEETDGAAIGLTVAGNYAYLAGVFGLIIMALFGGFGMRSAQTLQSRLWVSLGVGLLVFVVGPPVAATVFFIGIFTGGAWIGVFAGMVWVIALAVGYQIGALCTGRLIIRQFSSSPVHPIPAVLLGVFLFSIVSLISSCGRRRRSSP